MDERNWSNRIGLYFVLISSTFGLGNLWRFPYAVQENGGALFLILYFFFLFIIGTPLLISELMMGKIQRKGVLCASNLNAFAKSQIQKKANIFQRFLYKILSSYGYFSFIICFFILGYLSVVSGWVLYFLFASVLQLTRPEYMDVQSLTMQLHSQGWLQVLLASVHLFLMSFLIKNSFQFHVKRWLGYFSPVLGVFILILIYQIFSKYPLKPALQFMFYPDFQSFKWSSLSQAIGQLMLSLSIGLGAIVNFGSQFKEEDYIPAMGYRVSILDGLFSVLTMLLIIPLVFITSIYDGGPELIFKVVPLFFQDIEHGAIFSILFFSFLYLAAMGGTITLLQTQAQNMNEKFGIAKKHALQMIVGLSILLAIAPALTSHFTLDSQFSDLRLLERLDHFLINWLLPFVALLGSQQVRLYLDEKTVEKEFLEMKFPSTFLLFDHWRFVLKWVIPAVIIFSMAVNL